MATREQRENRSSLKFNLLILILCGVSIVSIVLWISEFGFGEKP